MNNQSNDDKSKDDEKKPLPYLDYDGVLTSFRKAYEQVKSEGVSQEAMKSLDKVMEICFRENLLAPNGTVLVDNAFLRTKAYDPEEGQTVAKSFATFLAAQTDLHKVLIPMRDGVYIVRRMCDVESADTQ